MMTIKGSLYWSLCMLRRFLAAKKLSSQNRFQKWRFYGNLRVYILVVVIGTPIRHILGRNDVFWCIFRKIRLGVWAVASCNNPKSVKNATPDGMENHLCGEQKPMPICVKIGQRVLAWRGVEFRLFPLTSFVAFKTLSHYRASVWYLTTYSTITNSGKTVILCWIPGSYPPSLIWKHRDDSVAKAALSLPISPLKISITDFHAPNYLWVENGKKSGISVMITSFTLLIPQSGRDAIIFNRI